MPNITFARPRYDYDSYTDLYTLIRLSGYPIIYFDEIDPQSDNCYIMTMVNGENQHGWQDARARIILYDLEWRLDGDYPQIPGVSEIWAADPWYARQIGAKYVTLGSHPGLNPSPDETADRVYDVIMLAYMSYRRMHIEGQLLERGIDLAPRGWGNIRHRALLASRNMLQVHQLDGVATIAPQRFALAAAYKMPIISECVSEPGVLVDAVLWTEYANIPAFVAGHRGSDFTAFGEALYQTLCVDHSFRKCIDEAL